MIQHDTRLDRLFDLLRTGQAYTYEELTTQLDCCTRQVRRLFRQLETQGYPVLPRTEGRRHHFYIPEEHLPKPSATLSLTEAQVYALTVAAQASQPALETTPLIDDLKRAIGLLVDAYGDEIYTFEAEDQAAHWHFGAPAHNDIDPDVFSSVRRAIRDSRTIEIDYTSLRGRISAQRPVDPYVIALRGTSWLLVARCHDRGVLNFSLPAIRQVTLTEQYFQRPPDFTPERHFKDAFTAMVGDEVHRVRLEIAPDKAASFARKSYHPTQKVEEQHPDGRLVVGYEVAGLDEIAAFVRGWGPGVVVLDPPELAERLAREAAEVAAQYAPAAHAG